MTGVACLLAAAIAAVVVVAAGPGVTAWTHLAKLAAVFGGWVVAALLVRWDARRFGEDGERLGRIVIFFGWVGLAYWLVKRIRLAPST